MKRTPTLSFHYDETIEQGVRISRLLRGGAMSERGRRWRATDLERVAAELRARDRFLLTAHEGPDGDALGSLLGMHHLLDPARQGLGDVHGGEGVPAADRVPLPAAGGGLSRAAGGHGRSHRRLPRLRQHRPDAGRLPHRGRQPRDQHRPPPRQHSLRRLQPGRYRRLLYGRDRLRAGDPARGARSPRRSPRRSTSGWSPTPASSCTRTPTRAPTGSPPI